MEIAVPVEQLARGQANIAVVLSGFAFAGFVLLLNHLSNQHLRETQPGEPVVFKDRSSDPHFRTMFLLIASFSMGVLAAYLFTTSDTGEPWSTYYGYQFAHVTLGLELLALIAAVNLMIGVHADRFSRNIAWAITVLMCQWINVRVLVETIRADGLRDASLGLSWASASAIVLTIVAVGPQIAAMAMALSGRFQIRKSGHPVMVFAVAFGVAGALLALGHTAFGIGMWPPGGLPRWVDFCLVLVTSLMAAWTLVISHPSNTRLRPEATTARSGELGESAINKARIEQTPAPQPDEPLLKDQREL